MVNDGSIDRSLDLAQGLTERHAQLRVVSYPVIRGRGFALRKGIQASRGELVFTTEVDGSWGPRIVHRMLEAMRKDPATDMVIASPHLSGGGYRNVAFHRVFLSCVGNWVIRAGHSFDTTMNTGMTRGYRRTALRQLPLCQHGKELHLEVLLKAHAFRWHIVEIPATIECRNSRRTARRKRFFRISLRRGLTKLTSVGTLITVVVQQGVLYG